MTELAHSQTATLKNVVVIIPAYNEQGKIRQTLEGIKAQAAEFERCGLTVRTYVIDDGSTDHTGKLAQESGCDRLIRHKTNLGLGAAVRSGLYAAARDGADIAVKFDADGQHDPADILPLIAPILADEADVVYGNRFDKIEYRMPFVRRIGNRSFTWLMRVLTGWPLRDSQPGIFAVSKDYLKVFYLPGDYNYTQQILLDAYHKGMRFAHVPVSFRRRTTGRSFVSLKYPFKVLPQLLMVLISVKPFKIFGPIGGVFLAAAVLIAVLEMALWLSGHLTKPIEHVNFVMGFGLFGLQTLFFGLLAELIVRQNKRQP
jgi:glycosyltransferase involved in cell wall biosynthesis